MPSGAALTGCNLASRGKASAEAERGIAAHPVLVQPVGCTVSGDIPIAQPAPCLRQRPQGAWREGKGRRKEGAGGLRESGDIVEETRENLSAGGLLGIGRW